MWFAILASSAGTYLMKLAGLAVPHDTLDRPRVRRIATLIPIALLAALAAVQVFVTGRHLVIDARAAGIAYAFIALLLRAPFLVVVIGAAVVAALVRAVF
jgi:branched-subunit amino acid transport protein